MAWYPGTATSMLLYYKCFDFFFISLTLETRKIGGKKTSKHLACFLMFIKCLKVAIQWVPGEFDCKINLKHTGNSACFSGIL